MNEWDRKVADLYRDQQEARKVAERAQAEKRSSEAALGRWFAHKASGVPLQSCSVSISWREKADGRYGGYERRSVSKPIAAWIVNVIPTQETFEAIHEGSYIFITPEGKSARCNKNGNSDTDFSLSGRVPEIPMDLFQFALKDGVSLYHLEKLLNWLLSHGITP